MTDVFASARGPLEPRPFPLAPLLALIDATPAALALRVGASGSTVHRAAAAGLTWHQADVWAVRIGKHPAEVWPSWWDHIDPEDVA
jgi:hypothetical protein